MDLILELLIFYGALILISVFGGHVFTIVALKSFKSQIKEKKGESLDGAGKLIGYLERLFIVFAILYGQFIIIGFLLTAKTIVRFEYIRDRKLAEYFLIGTLISVMFAFFTVIVMQAIASHYGISYLLNK